MRPVFAFVLCLLGALPLSAAESVLRVIGTEKTLELTTADWARLPRTELTVADPHDHAEHRYSGVDVRALLALAGAPSGHDLRGRALRLGVLVRARDGYEVLFALAEFDPAYGSRSHLLADRIDAAPLSAKAAPLQLIVPGDARAARWVRMVSSIEIAPLASAAASR